MKLHGKASYLTHGSDTQAPQRKTPRITKYVYYCLLIALLVYFLYFFGQRFFVFRYDAVVKQAQTWVRVEHGGLLTSLHVATGDEFTEGQHLATVGPARQCNTESIDRRLVENQADMDMLLLEIDTLNAYIQLKKRQIKSDNQSLIGVSRALEVTAPLEITQRIETLEDEMRAMEIDRTQKEGELALLVQAQKRLASEKEVQTDPTCLPEVIYAQRAGKVSQINVLIGQDLNAGDAILAYSATGSQVQVQAYLDYEEYEHISKGEEVTIVLPNGDELAATVKDISSSEKYMASVSETGHDATALPKMKVILSPADTQDVGLLKEYELQQVTIRGNK